MLQTEVVSTVVRTDVSVGRLQAGRRSLAAERAMDTVLTDSFPASDPPSWTPSIAEARPQSPAAVKPLQMTFSPSPVWLQSLASLAGAVVLALAFPLFIVGLPLALAWRAVLAATRWRTP